MNVLAINGSPRGGNSCTNQILQPLLEGMRLAGAVTEIINLSELEIKQCSGCFACWTKTPGKCILEDDMQQILPKLVAANLVIYATPLYSFSMTGLLKNFIDRGLPLAQKTVNEHVNAAASGQSHEVGSGERKILLVSPCGFPDFTFFEALVFYFKFYAKIIGAKYLGEILRPTGELLRRADFQDKLKTYYANLKLAGKQLIEQEKIDHDMQEKLHQLFISPEEYRILES